MYSFLPLNGRLVAATRSATSKLNHVAFLVIMQKKKKSNTFLSVWQLHLSSYFIRGLGKGGVMLGD